MFRTLGKLSGEVAKLGGEEMAEVSTGEGACVEMRALRSGVVFGACSAEYGAETKWWAPHTLLPEALGPGEM